MDIDSLTVGQLKELNLFSSRSTKKYFEEEYGGIRIVVLQRGWVAIGHFYQKGTKCRLEKAATIRIWGTSGKSGLSYLADEGPTKDTILDKTKNMVRFHELTVVHMYDCEKTKWENLL